MAMGRIPHLLVGAFRAMLPDYGLRFSQARH
jgi:hypothetical protein